MKKMIDEYCMSISQLQSQFQSQKSNLKYFDHLDLTLTKLYALFLEFYTAKTGLEITPIDKSTYSHYFKYISKFASAQTRADFFKF